MDLSRANWHKSSRSGGNGNCVEVAMDLVEGVAVRDTKDRDGGTLVFPTDGWVAFISGVRGGEFDLPA